MVVPTLPSWPQPTPRFHAVVVTTIPSVGTVYVPYPKVTVPVSAGLPFVPVALTEAARAEFTAAFPYRALFGLKTIAMTLISCPFVLAIVVPEVVTVNVVGELPRLANHIEEAIPLVLAHPPVIAAVFVCPMSCP